jgi:hypothetical protein
MAQLDPLDDSVHASIVGTLFLVHRYDESWAMMTPADADHPRLYSYHALLANRHIERYEERLQAIADQLLDHPNNNPVDRAMLLMFMRDYEGAMAEAEAFERPSHWPEPALPFTVMTQLLVYWLEGDEASLAQAVTEARQRAEQMVADNPALQGYIYHERDMLMLDVLDGNVEQALLGLRAWERDSLSDWAVRTADREMVCGMYGILGLAREAVDCLRTGLEEPSLVEPFMSPWIPFFDRVRDTPEFQAFIAEL